MEQKKSENDRIQKRILELQKELQMHQQRANQAQQVLNEESRQILAKQGAVLEFQKLLEEPRKKEDSNL